MYKSRVSRMIKNLHKSQIKNVHHPPNNFISSNPQDCWLESPESGMSKSEDTGSPVCTRYSLNILNEELQKESQSSRDLSGGLRLWNREIRTAWARLLLAGWWCCLQLYLVQLSQGRAQLGEKRVWAFLSRGTERHLIASLDKENFHLCGREINLRSVHAKRTERVVFLPLKEWAILAHFEGLGLFTRICRDGFLWNFWLFWKWFVWCTGIC